MSETKHGPEPWHYVGDSGAIEDDKGALCAEGWGADGLEDLNARRIVACVNYLAGIPTDVLEKRIEERRTDAPYGVKSLRLIREAAKRGMHLDSDGRLILQTGKIAAAEPDDKGYRSLNLSVDGERCKITLARVVCFLAHGEPEDPQAVADHIDGNILNDHPSNLRWSTYSENLRNRSETREAERRRHAEEFACAGIPSEALESGALGEALDALAGLVYCADCWDNPQHNVCEKHLAPARAALRRLGRLP